MTWSMLEFITFFYKNKQHYSEFLNEYLSSLEIFHISSVLHIWASWTKAFLLFCDWNNFFSKPVDRSTPSHRYPGMIPKRFGAGGGPLYLGYSENSKKTRFFKKMIEKNCNGNVTKNKRAHSSEMRGLCSTNKIF